MTHSDYYIPYIISRLFAGFFGAVPTVLGPRIVTDIFFLHQRGRAFTALHMAFLFGTIAGPTFSGFISADVFFPVEFWWTVGLLGFTLICCFLLLEETGFDRRCLENNPEIPRGLVANRFATFFFGQRVVLPTTWKETVRLYFLEMGYLLTSLLGQDWRYAFPHWNLSSDYNHGHFHSDLIWILRRR